MFRFILLLGLLSACSLADQNQKLNLITPEFRRAFLGQLFEDDQELRQGKSSLILNKHVKDSINVIQTELYLSNYGYPAKADLGEVVSNAPWAVIHHSNDLDVRNRNFQSINNVYINEDLDDSAMSMYLGKSYELTFGERFEMPSPFKNEDRIEKLIELLGLTDLANNGEGTPINE